MKARKFFLLFMTILFTLSCDKDEHFDEFEVDINISGDFSKFEGGIILNSIGHDGYGYLFSSAEGNNVYNDGQNGFFPREVGLNSFYTSTNIKWISVSHNYIVTLEALEDENWRDFTLTVTVTVRRNGSEIDNVTTVYGGESGPSEFYKEYSIN